MSTNEVAENNTRLSQDSGGQKSTGLPGFWAPALTKPKPSCPLIGALMRRLSGRICSQVHAGCWQNPVLCGSRNELCVSFLLVSRGYVQLLEIALHSLHGAPRPRPVYPLHCKASNGASNPSELPIMLLGRENLSGFLGFFLKIYLFRGRGAEGERVPSQLPTEHRAPVQGSTPRP